MFRNCPEFHVTKGVISLSTDRCKLCQTVESTFYHRRTLSFYYWVRTLKGTYWLFWVVHSPLNSLQAFPILTALSLVYLHHCFDYPQMHLGDYLLLTLVVFPLEDVLYLRMKNWRCQCHKIEMLVFSPRRIVGHLDRSQLTSGSNVTYLLIIRWRSQK